MLDRENMHGYQVTGHDHIISHTHCALFKEMGLGKTVTTLTAINTLIYEELEIDRVLVIAPKRVVESVWEEEARKWRHLRHLTFSKVTGDTKQRRVALHRKADIYLMGRDNVAWLCGQYGGSMLPFDMLVIDELSSFKNHDSVRFKALKGVQPSFSRVVGLTGTPAPNGLIDLWSQIYLLDRGHRLGKFIGKYRETYFRKGATNGHITYNYILKAGGDTEIHRLISDICLSMKSRDYLDLPELIENEIVLHFPPDVQKMYNDFERDQVLEMFGDDLSEPDISAVNAAALSNKLLQFANGAVYDDVKNWHTVHDMKIDALKEIVEAADSPVLVGWTYRHDLYRMQEAFKGKRFRQLTDNQDILDWNNGDVDILAMHPASGGHGLNLQAGGNTIVWFGQTWSLELYQQFNARLDRQGQEKPVIVHKLIAKGTVDEDVVKAQSTKADKQNALMEAVKARILKYIL